MTKSRNLFIIYALESKLLREIISLIMEYDYMLEGYITNVFRLKEDDDTGLTNLKALTEGGFICNIYLDSDFYYIKNPEINDIQVISPKKDFEGGEVDEIFVFPNNTIILPISHNGTEYIYIYYNLSLSTESFLLFENTSYVKQCIKISETEFCFGFHDGTIMVWDILDKELKYTLNKHTEYITDLLLLPNGKLVSSGFDSLVITWNLETKNPENIYISDQNIYKLYHISDTKICILNSMRKSVITTYDYKTNEQKSKALKNRMELIENIIISNNKIIFKQKRNIVVMNSDTLEIDFKLDNIHSIDTIILLPDARIMTKSINLTIWNLTTKTIDQISPIGTSSIEIDNLIVLPNNLIAYQSDKTIEIHN